MLPRIEVVLSFGENQLGIVREEIVMPDFSLKDIPLPGGWPEYLRTAVLHGISVGHLAILYARGWAANSCNMRIRLQAQLEQARNENSLLQEELRIKDARMGMIDPLRRPHYQAIERMASWSSRRRVAGRRLRQLDAFS